MRHRPRHARDEILWDMDHGMALRLLFVTPNGGMVSTAWRLCRRCGITMDEGPSYSRCAVWGAVVREADGT
jgi:hypothetical protein